MKSKLLSTLLLLLLFELSVLVNSRAPPDAKSPDLGNPTNSEPIDSKKDLHKLLGNHYKRRSELTNNKHNMVDGSFLDRQSRGFFFNSRADRPQRYNPQGGGIGNVQIPPHSGVRQRPPQGGLFSSFNPFAMLRNGIRNLQRNRQPYGSKHLSTNQPHISPYTNIQQSNSYSVFSSDPSKQNIPFPKLSLTPPIGHGDFGQVKPESLTIQEENSSPHQEDLDLKIPHDLIQYQTLELDIKPNGDIEIRPKTETTKSETKPDNDDLSMNAPAGSFSSNNPSFSLLEASNDASNYEHDNKLMDSNPKSHDASKYKLTNGNKRDKDTNIVDQLESNTHDELTTATRNTNIPGSYVDVFRLRTLLKNKQEMLGEMDDILRKNVLPYDVNHRSALPPRVNSDFARVQDKSMDHIYLVPFNTKGLSSSRENVSPPSMESVSSFINERPKYSSHSDVNFSPTVNSPPSNPSEIYYIDITIPDKRDHHPIVNHHRIPASTVNRRNHRTKRDVPPYPEKSINRRHKRESKLIEYNGWNPLNLNDPMSDHPTLVYRPPTLRRVRFKNEPSLEPPEFPIVPQNPPVYVIRIDDPQDAAVDEVYGTETVDYLHFYPHSGNGKMFTSSKFKDKITPCDEKEDTPSPEKTLGDQSVKSKEEEENNEHLQKQTDQRNDVIENENDNDFQEKSFTVEEDYYYYYDDDENSFQEEEAIDLDTSPTDVFSSITSNIQKKTVNTRNSLPPSKPQRYRSRNQKRPSLYELLKNFSGLQNDRLSAAESRQNSLIRQAPPRGFNTRPAKQSTRVSSRQPSARRISNRKLSKEETTLPWLLIKTKSDKPLSSRKTNARKQDLIPRKARPVSQRNRYVYNPDLQQYMSAQRTTESLTANSLSELLQIFDYVTTPDPFRSVTQRSRTTEHFQTFRYTKPADGDESYITTTRRPSIVGILPQEAPPRSTLSKTSSGVRPSLIRPPSFADDLVQTNSLDGYLFSDSEARPKYSRPNKISNEILSPTKRTTQVTSSTTKKTMDDDAIRRGDLPSLFVTDLGVESTTPAETTTEHPYRIFEGHSKVRLFGGVPVKQKKTRKSSVVNLESKQSNIDSSSQEDTHEPHKKKKEGISIIPKASYELPTTTVSSLVKIVPLPVLDHSKIEPTPVKPSSPEETASTKPKENTSQVTWVRPSTKISEPTRIPSIAEPIEPGEGETYLGTLLPSALAAFSRLFYGDSIPSASSPPEIQDTRQARYLKSHPIPVLHTRLVR